MKKNLPLQGSVILASILSFNASANESGTSTTQSFLKSLPMPTLYGDFDVSFGFEKADDAAFAFEDAVSDSANYIGIKGEIPLNNGNKVTYVHEEIINVVNGGGFGGSNQTYLGYKTEKGEFRVGNLVLPLKRVMDKIDLFAGTYGDLSTLVVPNTTSNSALMFMGGNETVDFAVSIDTGVTGNVVNNGVLQAVQAENANNSQAIKQIRLGLMGDVQLNETISVGAGFEHSYLSTAYGFVAEMNTGENLTITTGFSHTNFRNGGSPMTLTAGAAIPVGEDGKIKAQFGIMDSDYDERAPVGTPPLGLNTPKFVVVGYDKKFSDNLTAYGLTGYYNSIPSGVPNVPTSPNSFNAPSTLEFDSSTDPTNLASGKFRDNNGGAFVLAAGVKFTF